MPPRLDALIDDGYLWEPVAGSWNVRPFTVHAPGPAPVTTIAWQLAHVVVVFGMRVASHVGGPVGYDDVPYPGTAAEALAQFDETRDAWFTGVRGLDDEAQARPGGPAEEAFAREPMATLVRRIRREAIHHGAEISLLRDPYRAKITGSGT